MGRLRIALIVALLMAVGPFVTPGTAGGSVTWTDQPGDATGLDPLPPPAHGVITSSPRPQDDGLDLLGASASSDGQAVVFTARTASADMPAGASGATIRFWFSYDGVGYQFIAQRPAPDFATVVSSGVFLRSQEPRSPELACRECTVRYDPKTATVIVRAEVKSMATAIKQHAPNSKKFGAGSTVTDLLVRAERNVLPLARDVDVARTLTADEASGEGKTLAV
ncbi:MAG TPA: hypothetical protein VMY88_08565 [Acidimicrobiales bacterium]|nr:hypothetical protein [Acidimicrobiales bacterium]